MTRETILDNILEKVEVRLKERKAATPLSALEKEFQTRTLASGSKHNFIATFKHASPLPCIIAEIKFKSPSEGELRQARDPCEIAREYILNGASALSILTEEDYFDGSNAYLRQVRLANPNIPILCKDFVVDEYQILEAKLSGADAILLMVSVLGQDVKTFQVLCDRYNIDALVEVHNEEELEIALHVGTGAIGVNNRDLKTLQVSLATAEELIQKIPREVVAIAESGLSDLATLQRLSTLGYRGFLVGTAFMKSPHPGERLATLLRGSHVQG